MTAHHQLVETREVDPFYLYVHLTRACGQGQTFLLDAAQEHGSEDYRMSLIGALPVLEIQVKDGSIALFSELPIANFLQEKLKESGYMPISQPEFWRPQSVVEGPVYFYHQVDPMQFLEQLRLALQSQAAPNQSPVPFSTGLFGYIGYDAVHYLERLPKTTEDDRGLPDVRLQWFAVVVQLVDGRVSCYGATDLLAVAAGEESLERYAARIHDVEQHVARYCRNPIEPLIDDVQQGNPEIVDDVVESQFIDNVERAKAYIGAGDIFQVVLSKRMRMTKTEHHYAVYDRLRRVNPSPYMFMAEYPDMRLFGASPEVQFRSAGGRAEMKPIAGTSKGRGKSEAADRALAEALLADEKERAEHVMLVDLCRNDLGRVCEIGSIHVDDFMQVEPYSHLFHLVSRVTGTLRANTSVFHALLATFPAGTLSGAPKIRAMEIIDELESYRRGPYGGMVGVIDFAGNANTAIVIRSVVEVRDTYFVQVGAGIVADSNPVQEWNECGHKAGALLDVLGRKPLQLQ